MKKGTIFSEEHKKNLSISHLGKIPWNKGIIIKPKKQKQFFQELVSELSTLN